MRYDPQMVILSVMYPKSPQSRFDYDYYLQTHMPLVNERLEGMGLEGVRLMRGTAAINGSGPSFEVIAELSFASLERLRDALSRHGQEIIADIENFTNIEPIIQINDMLPAQREEA